jgi:hypothetical protein
MTDAAPARDLGTTRLGPLEISRLTIGGNPFSGFSHQTPERNDEMRHWYTAARIKDALRHAEQIGVTAHVGRADHHVMRFLMEHWDEEHLSLDFYMCSYYNAAHRDKNAELQSGQPEWFHASDRAAMAARIAGLSRPAIHYKIFAAGRNDPAEALDFVAEHLRPQDAVCVGVFTKDNPDMLADDARLLAAALRRHGKI